MGELERIGNEGWELVLIRNDINEEGEVTGIFKRQKSETISIWQLYYHFTIFIFIIFTSLKILTLTCLEERLRSHLEKFWKFRTALIDLVQEEVWYWTHGLRAYYLFIFNVVFWSRRWNISCGIGLAMWSCRWERKSY